MRYPYSGFTQNRIRPEGWLRRQLEIQATGLSGNLDKIWPDVRDSAWIGGDREGWERVPYWLDGFIPLAYLLEDTDLIARADRYITAILDRQQEDGWICPCNKEARATYDLWAHILIGKVLALYVEFTGDSRAADGLYRAMKCLHELLSKGEVKLFQWGEFRWFEALIPLLYLQQQKPEPWITELAQELRRQGADYPSFQERWKRPINQWTFETHIVNLCMMLKFEALTARLLGEPYTGEAERMWRVLERYNGTAVGIFTGDECLSGRANNQGTELCSVAELMYSCEWLYAQTGKGVWADRLEKAAFNALPATLSDDMWTHQYDQMVNQIACQRFPGRSLFRTNSEEAHLFGLEPNFGCCTANFNQAWPKLAMHTFLRSRDGVVCAMMLPASVQTEIGGVPVTVRMETDYPFRHHCRYVVTADRPVEMSLTIRIPGWAESATVEGETVKAGTHYVCRRRWEGTTVLTVELTAAPQMKHRPNGLKTVEYGPLVFALPIKTDYVKLEFERGGVERKFPYCDYELVPQSAWNYGFAGKQAQVCEKEGDGIPFSSENPRLTLKMPMSQVAWDFADGFTTVSAEQPLSNKALTPPEELELYPYGCAKLRMTEMPLVRPAK